MITNIVTHPGGAHKDDFLACAVLLSKYPVSIFRREPSEKELANPEVAVVDIGHRFEPELNNFDHHQFDRDLEPTSPEMHITEPPKLAEIQYEFWLFPARVPKSPRPARPILTKLTNPLRQSRPISVHSHLMQCEIIKRVQPVQQVPKVEIAVSSKLTVTSTLAIKS